MLDWENGSSHRITSSRVLVFMKKKLEKTLNNFNNKLFTKIRKANGEESLSFGLLNKLSKHLNYTKVDPAEVDQSESNETNETAVATQTDQHNHVSYSFSFFLHGSSRVCTSVDMKLHRPIRLLNTSDLFRLKQKMKKFFATSSDGVNGLPSSLIFNGTKSKATKSKFKGRKLKIFFKRLKD